MLQLTFDSIKTCIQNLIIFSLIPFIWWFIRHRKEENFFKWIGFQVPHLKSNWLWLLGFAIVYIAFYNFDAEFLLSQKTIHALNESGASVESNQWAGLGVSAILPAFLTTFIANGVAEEILFRGFLCKRFSEKFGYLKGVLLQATFFGLMHVLLVLASGMGVGVDFYIYEFVYTFLGALLLGFANEKLFNSSIWPSICLHGMGNFISNLFIILG
ncbi:MAG: lysostaphin resistance A-like protein [Lachnospiraceae bacterium]